MSFCCHLAQVTVLPGWHCLGQDYELAIPESQFVRPAASPCNHGKEETVSEIYHKEETSNFGS
jgi:hypothetical protein